MKYSSWEIVYSYNKMEYPNGDVKNPKEKLKILLGKLNIPAVE